MKNLDKIKEETPELLNNPDILQLAEQADVVHSLKALHDTDGGKQLVKLLIEDALGCVHRLSGGYHTMSHIEMVSLCAQLDTKLATAKLLIDSKQVKEVLDAELEEAMRE
jgi:hypothetical protein